jgi:hypothetical protein
LTPEEREDIRQAVRFHRTIGGYTEHNAGGRFCRCAACRVVRLVVDLDEAQEAVETLWGQLDEEQVKGLEFEHPEVVALARLLYDETHP